jgi:hypothetical protein
MDHPATFRGIKGKFPVNFPDNRQKRRKMSFDEPVAIPRRERRRPQGCGYENRHRRRVRVIARSGAAVMPLSDRDRVLACVAGHAQDSIKGRTPGKSGAVDELVRRRSNHADCFCCRASGQRAHFVHQGRGSMNRSVVAQSVSPHSGHGSAWLKRP